jgi:hypothetical protein
MPGYLDTFGQSDARHERGLRFILLSLLAVAVLSLGGYVYFKNWSEKQRAREFLRVLQNQDYARAYSMFGCTEASPCRDFPYQKFLEDWGPSNLARRPDRLSIGGAEECGNGLLVNIEAGGRTEENLLIDSATRTIGYAPWPECPEPRFRLWKWIKMRTGIGQASR